MRNESRTRKQIDADRLDMEIARVVVWLDRFSDYYRDHEVRKAVNTVSAIRHCVRKHMHPKDIKATPG